MTDKSARTVALEAKRYTEPEMLERARGFADEAARRRSVRDFSSEPVARNIIEHCLLAAGSAPSGANRQPWHFSVISNPAIKREIRNGAEEEEKEFYERRAPQDWLDALAPFGTDANKPFLESAPYLIVVFAEKYCALPDRGICREIQPGRTGAKAKKLLCPGIRGHRHRHPDQCIAPRRACHTNAHAQPDEIPEPDSGAPGAGETHNDTGSGLPGSCRQGTGHQAQTAGRYRQFSGLITYTRTSSLPASCLSRHTVLPVHRRYRLPASRDIPYFLYIKKAGPGDQDSLESDDRMKHSKQWTGAAWNTSLHLLKHGHPQTK